MLHFLRKAGPPDLKLLVPLFDLYRQFYHQPSDPQACARFLQARMERNESEVFLVTAEQDGQELGLGFCQLYPSFSSVQMGRLWILNDLYVREAYRSQGIGYQLIERAKQLVTDTGAGGLMLETGITNKNAQEFYARQGFRADTETLIYLLMQPYLN